MLYCWLEQQQWSHSMGGGSAIDVPVYPWRGTQARRQASGLLWPSHSCKMGVIASFMAHDCKCFALCVVLCGRGLGVSTHYVVTVSHMNARVQPAVRAVCFSCTRVLLCGAPFYNAPDLRFSTLQEGNNRTFLRVSVHVRMYQQTATSEDNQTPEVRRCRSDGELLVDQGDRLRPPTSDEAGDEEAGKPAEGVGGSGSGAARARPSGLGGPGGVKVAMTPAQRGSGGRAARQPPVSSRSERKPPRYSISAAENTVGCTSRAVSRGRSSGANGVC